METPLTASNNQGDKLRERIGIALLNSGVPKDQVQLALEYPGTGLEDEWVTSIVRYSKKASGVVTPVGALETGLIPKGWSVESDDLEGDVDLGKLDFSFAPCKSDESYINGDKMIERAKAAQALGSLGLAKIILDEQAAGRQVIPEELQGVKYIILSRTILRDGDGDRRVACLFWRGGQWVLGFHWIGYDFYSDGVVPRVRE